MSLEDSLSALEQLIEKISAALLAADSRSLESSSAALRDAAAQFAQVLQQSTEAGAPPPAFMQWRLDAVRERLAVQRDALARLGANADRQVATLLPPSDAASTYDSGLNPRQAKPGVARIYRSAS